MIEYVRRLKFSNDRVTQGTIYLLADNRIIDDLGKPMQPSMAIKGYWTYVAEAAYELQEQENSKPQLTKESTMLKIETVVLINGQRLKEFKADTLIGYIQKEEAHIDALKEVRAQSKAITNLKNRHQANIKALVTILDDIDEDDE